MSTIAPSSWAKPEPDWLTYEQTRFYFLPKFTGRGPDWKRSVVSRLSPLLDAHGVDWEQAGASAEEDISLRIGELQINFQPEGVSWISLIGSEEPLFGWDKISANGAADPNHLPEGTLLEIKYRLKQIQLAPPYREDMVRVQMIIDLLISLFSLDNSDFDFHAVTVGVALEQKWVRIVARSISPLAPFTEIQPDQWRYYSWSGLPDAAIGPRDEQLFSVYFVPVEASAHRSIPMARIDLTTSCRKWLAGMMRSNLFAAPRTKTELKTEANDRFEGLSDRGFEHAWRTAIEETGAKWNSPGRRPKTPHL